MENLDLDHLLDSSSANPFNFPTPSKSRDASPSTSYDAEEEDDATSYTRTIDSSDSDTTMLTNSKGCFVSPRGGRHGKSNGKRRGDDAEGNGDDNDTNALDMERLKELGDRVITLSTETFCWIMDSTLDICNDLRGMVTKVEEKGCQSCANEVAEDIFTSMSSESFSDFEDENPSKMVSRRTEPKKKRGLSRFWRRKSSTSKRMAA